MSSRCFEIGDIVLYTQMSPFVFNSNRNGPVVFLGVENPPGAVWQVMDVHGKVFYALPGELSPIDIEDPAP